VTAPPDLVDAQPDRKEAGQMHPVRAGRPDGAELLAAVRGRISALAEDLPEDLVLAAQPWDDLTVRDVIAHLAATHAAVAGGQAVDFSRLCPAGSGDGTSRHSAASVPELLKTWQAGEGQLAEIVRDDPAMAACLLADTVAHEHDLRTATDQPAYRDDPSVIAALETLAAGLSQRIAARGLPALRITVEQWGTIAGEGPARRCLVADRFEFVRGMTGRRSAAQASRWNWSDEPGEYLEVLSATGALAPVDVRERDPRVPEHLADFDLRH
jgi:hypothetical protein